MLGILGAMPEEVAMLKQAMTQIQTQTYFNRTYYQGELYGREVVLVQGGIGKVRASITATALTCHFPIQGIVFTGVAGALRSGLKVGDVVIAHRGIEHDFGMGRADQFTLGLDFLPEERSTEVSSDPQLYQLALDRIQQHQLSPMGSHQPEIRAGIVASGDTFVASERVRHEIFARTQADVVEMEGVAVLRVAQDAGIPCVLIRSVSDEGNSDDFLDIFATVAHNSAEIVRMILHPA